jgi:hypothetical protein
MPTPFALPTDAATHIEPPQTLTNTEPRALPIFFHLPTPFSSPGWLVFLSEHPDCLGVDTLLHIVEHGARMAYCGPRHWQFIVSQNLTPTTPCRQKAIPSIHYACRRTRYNNRRYRGVHTLPVRLPAKSEGWPHSDCLSYPGGYSVKDHIPAE